MPKSLASFAALTLLVLATAGCGRVTDDGAAEDLSARQIKIVSTTQMVTDLVERVGGDRVKVEGLMGPGVDPHLYKASEGDVIALAGADAVFYSGLHLEAKLAEVFERMGEQVHTYAVTDSIPRSRLEAPPAFKGNYDPHVWFDVTFWMLAAEQIRDTLIQIDPDHRSGYEERAAAYLDQLRELDAYVFEQAAKIPEDRRVLITAHDAFGYFGRRYGFEVRGLQGVSTATEAGTRDVQDLADFIADRQIPAIFVESSVPRRTVEALQAAVQSRGWDVQIGGQLYSDAMGDAGTVEGTYLGMVRANIDTITNALLGQGEQ